MDARRTEGDEQTPLLRTGSHVHHARKHSPIPWAQLSIILVLQFGEVFSLMVIYPFTPELVRNIGITDGDEARVGYYVGLMQSIFAATEVVTVLFWSWISDHLGRRPIIMAGVLGISVSMYCFGLSRTFWGLVASGSLKGALNGNIGVFKSMMAEITDPSSIAQAAALVPVAWSSSGAVVGLLIGGSLSRPAERFPSVFGESEFFKKYPYFLPCSIPATFSALACIVTFFYLKEEDVSQGLTMVTADDSSPGPLPIRRLLIPRVIIAAGNYAFISVLDTALRVVQPVFCSTPIEHGGLGLEPSRIGLIGSLGGIVTCILQIFCFRKIHDRFGTKRTYLAGVAGVLPAFGLLPLINQLARLEGLSVAVWVLVVAQALMSTIIIFGFGCVFIFVAASAPNKASLGTVNGMAEMTVAILRMVAPVTASSLFSLSIDQEHHYMGRYLVYCVLVAAACVAFYVGTLLPDKTMSDETILEES